MTTITPKYGLSQKLKRRTIRDAGLKKQYATGPPQEQESADRSARTVAFVTADSLPVSLLLAAHRVVVFDLGDRRKGYLDYLAVRAFYLHARGGECLSGLHAPDNAPHALTVNRHDLDIVLAVQRLKGRKCFCDFHVYLFSEVPNPFGTQTLLIL